MKAMIVWLIMVQFFSAKVVTAVAAEEKIGLIPLYSQESDERREQERKFAKVQKRLEERWGIKTELLLEDLASIPIGPLTHQKGIQDWDDPLAVFPDLSVLNYLQQQKHWSAIFLVREEKTKPVLYRFSDARGVEPDDGFSYPLQPLITDLANPAGTDGTSEKGETRHSPAWYNDWKVWAIGVGLLAVSGSVLLLTKGNSQPYWKGSIE